jgi:ribose transport system substrate-binding protein
MRKFLVVLVAVLVLGILIPLTISAEEPEKEFNISMLLGTLDNPHWINCAEAGKQAGEDLGANVTVLAVDREGDAVQQTAQFEDRLAAGDDAIVVAFMDTTALAPVIEQANEARVVLTAVDKTSDIGEIASVVQTDNDLAGYLGAKQVAEMIGGKGKVAVLEGAPGSQVYNERKAGSHRAFGEYPDIEIVASIAAFWETAKAQAATEDIITAHPDIAGLFACNDTMVLGAIGAFEAAGMMDDVHVTGLDGADFALDLVADGVLDGTVAQFPGRMGYLGVEYAIRALRGEEVPALVGSGEQLITIENVYAFRAGWFGG